MVDKVLLCRDFCGVFGALGLLSVDGPGNIVSVRMDKYSNRLSGLATDQLLLRNDHAVAGGREKAIGVDHEKGTNIKLKLDVVIMCTL